jgi:hypothetical protein
MRPFFLDSRSMGLYNLLKEKKILLIGVIYFFLSACILYKYGINTNGEAIKYIEDARRILDGEKLRIEFFSIFYIVYSLIISVFIYFSLSFDTIAVIQILFCFIAGCCVFKILQEITGDKTIAYICLIFYLACFPLQKWNFFLYTESLHTSFTVIGLYLFYCILYKNQTSKWWLYLFILLLIIFSRPVGITFLLASFLTWLICIVKKKNTAAYYSAIIGCIIIVILILLSPFTFYFNPDSLRRMEIICQVPQTNASLNYREYNNSGLSSFFYVITHEIGLKNFLLTGIKKVGYFFGMIREFYSLRQNSILLFTDILLYPLTIAGIFFFRNTKAFYIKLFSLLYILITATGIFFTCDEWSNRFIAPVLPHIIILGGLGLFYIRSRAKRN